MKKKLSRLLLAAAAALALSAVLCTAAAAADAVYYLKDGGTGDGLSADAPGGALADAYAALPNGGTVVVCGTYSLSSAFTEPVHAKPITITSVYGGRDYAAENNARLLFKGNFYLGGDT